MIALHLSNRHIRIVDGTVSGQRVTVQAMYDEEDTRGCILNGIVMDVDDFSDLMRTIWEKYNLPRKDVHLVINSSQFTTKILELPKQSEKLLMQFISREFSDVERIEDPVYSYYLLDDKTETRGSAAPIQPKARKEKSEKTKKSFGLTKKEKGEKSFGLKLGGKKTKNQPVPPPTQQPPQQQMPWEQPQAAQPAASVKAESEKKSEKVQRVFAQVVSRQYVQNYIELFQNLGITIESVEGARVAMLRLLEIAPLGNGMNSIIQMVDDITMLDVLVSDGRVEYCSRKRLFADRTTPSFAVEVARSLENILQFAQAHHLSESGINQVYISGLESEELSVYMDSVERINAAISVNPLQIENFVNITSRPNNGESFADFSIAIGGLLPTKNKTSLLSQVTQKPEASEKTKKRRKIVIPVCGLGIVLLGIGGFFGFRVMDLSRQVQSIKAYNERPEVIEAVSRYDTATAELQAISTLHGGLTGLKESILKYPLVNSETQEVLSRCASGLVTATISSYSSASGVITFQATANNEGQINQFIALLKKEKIFGDVNYTGYIQDATQQWNVKVSVTMAGRQQEEQNDAEVNGEG